MSIAWQIYLVIYRSDYHEMQILKKGAAINSYSVTRSYQLRENINLMNVRPFCILCQPILDRYPGF